MTATIVMAEQDARAVFACTWRVGRSLNNTQQQEETT